MRAKFFGVMRSLLGLSVLLVGCGVAGGQGQSVPAGKDATPRIGVLIPVGPPDYKVLFDAFTRERTDHLGPYAFEVGTIARVPVVLSLAPSDGPLLRSLAAQRMFEEYTVRVVVYPGTSGAHLGPEQMRVGDVVLGSKNVDFGNFFMSKAGEVQGGEFDTRKTRTSTANRRKYADLYADGKLLGMLACSATRVAGATALPGWVNPVYPRVKPDIFYFGTQGTSTFWLTNREFMEKINRSFGVIDEDGDWYSNVAAVLNGVPFVEVSTIANSILEFPETERGLPVGPGPGEASSVLAQRISNRIAVDLITRYGKRMLAGGFANPTANPWPAAYYETPKDARDLMAGGVCE